MTTSNTDHWYTLHQPKLSQFIQRQFSLDPANADDLTHDAFVRLYHGATDSIRNPAAHLYTTTRHLAIDACRREQRHRTYTLSEQEQVEAGSSHSPEQLLALSQQLELLLAALETLPWKCQYAFWQHRVDGDTHSDIANALNVSISSVEKYIMRATATCHSARTQLAQ